VRSFCVIVKFLTDQRHRLRERRTTLLKNTMPTGL
jgi:hypothetical protein